MHWLWSLLSGILGQSTTPNSLAHSWQTTLTTDWLPMPIYRRCFFFLASYVVKFPCWKPLPLDILCHLLLESSAKSCELDLLMLFLIKNFVDDLLPFVQLLCNTSLCHFQLLINELWSLKPKVLDSSDISNYHPYLQPFFHFNWFIILILSLLCPSSVWIYEV